MPTGRGRPGFNFNYVSIFANAPMESGVYGLYKGKACIYVGESSDVRARLLEHLHADNPCITEHGPTSFKYELVAGRAQREARKNQLIAGLNPACNRSKG